MTHAGCTHTIRTICEQYLTQCLRGGGIDDQCFARWWVSHWGATPVENLTHSEILDLAQLLRRQGKKDGTLSYYLRFLRNACAWAVTSGLLVRDPCIGVPLPKEKPLPLRILTEEEESTLGMLLGTPYDEWIRFAILTGLRESEQFHLRWADVDFPRGAIMLPHPTSGTFVAFSLPPEALALLKQWRAASESPWVFPDPDNFRQSVDFHAFHNRQWVPAVTAAGLRGLCWKDLRHTAGARLVLKGYAIIDIQHFMRLWNKKHAYRYKAALDGSRPTRVAASFLSPFIPPKQDEIQRVLERNLDQQPVTFGELARLYATQHLQNRPSRKNFDRLYRQYWKEWEDRPAVGIQRKSVVAWFMALAHTPSHANKALTFLRRLYNWGKQFDLLDCPNPTEHIPLYREHSRERFLSLDESRRFMQGLTFSSIKLRAFILVLILTGCRRGEARTMRWSDVDWEARLWRKPRTKNGVGHVVPLPTQAVEVLRELPRINNWIFPGRTSEKPWSAASIEDQWILLRRRLGIEGVRLHDLRRTCASYLAISGENLPTIQNVLNHRSLGPTAIYARLNVGAVDRALQRQADRLTSLREAPEPNMITAEIEALSIVS